MNLEDTISRIITDIDSPDFDGEIGGATLMAVEHGRSWLYRVWGSGYYIEVLRRDDRYQGRHINPADLTFVLAASMWDELI